MTGSSEVVAGVEQSSVELERALAQYHEDKFVSSKAGLVGAACGGAAVPAVPSERSEARHPV